MGSSRSIIKAVRWQSAAASQMASMSVGSTLCSKMAEELGWQQHWPPGSPRGGVGRWGPSPPASGQTSGSWASLGPWHVGLGLCECVDAELGGSPLQFLFPLRSPQGPEFGPQDSWALDSLVGGDRDGQSCPAAPGGSSPQEVAPGPVGGCPDHTAVYTARPAAVSVGQGQQGLDSCLAELSVSRPLACSRVSAAASSLAAGALCTRPSSVAVTVQWKMMSRCPCGTPGVGADLRVAGARGARTQVGRERKPIWEQPQKAGLEHCLKIAGTFCFGSSA